MAASRTVAGLLFSSSSSSSSTVYTHASLFQQLLPARGAANVALAAITWLRRSDPPSPALFVKNLSFNVTPAELFDLFGKFGPVRQIRQGIANNTKGTAFVVYEDVMDAKSACDKLNGFNFQNRYLVVLYHQPDKMLKAASDLAERQENLEKLKKQHGID
ncbi:pre-mrna branch site protein [Pyrenophora tritici-repentis]|uniref:Pre-mrna branch site protein n=2 Tax=Pyrenophora tritici-repentis TaxID=45151 RepID=A0A2W1H1M8_9PLEO|nr:uncharacterized protein PTRG_02020 [Pyrenophora tritici-repentis Pt-1C-BFP]KAI0585826.1 pre-mrna branch site protein [Pyrenophora tritici-repentis]EDU41458.1 hypothetical protein PTRG_02020 [Pyrenophora tritici-repentis Pt-1C-BFP]KAI0587651.1 pre-mrna branch site protein [Pyrenophora tritici-repentis]KAI0621415.1 hypothetical protein TUN199_06586 [Pyrenophora tritici-repentis]KAI1517975.1 pre-mrna branch site protein [Pyrenophora tritici-repentis]